MPQISFEFFSPKTITAAFSLNLTAEKLAEFAPQFSSVTCSKDPAKTLDTLRALQRTRLGRVHAHVTCATQKPADLPAYIKAAQAAGADGLIALRGDAAPEGLDVLDLIACAKQNTMQKIFVAAYPEVHPLAQSTKSDLDWLKRKQDAGATAAITQFFFHTDFFLRFRDNAADQGINLPIIPGILPVQNWTATQAMARSCGTSIAPDLAEGFARAEREGRAEMMAIAQATELCDSLIQYGAEHLHFYTMNRAEVVSAICTALGKAPKQSLHRVA
jgi:methylenetetrahydrofolate reductase (NADPH)